MFEQLNIGGTRAPAVPGEQPVSGGEEQGRQEPAPPEVALRALDRAAPARVPPPAVVRRVPQPPGIRLRGRASRWWVAGIASAVVIAVGAAAAGFLIGQKRPDAVSLQAVEREGVLTIEWDGSSEPVIRARKGSIEIVERGGVRRHDLSAAELRKGAFAVIRRGDDVTAKLILTDSAGGVRQELSRYLGTPIMTPTDSHLTEIEELKKQNETLRNDLYRERARANELQSWTDVLESSLKKRDARLSEAGGRRTEPRP